MEEKKRAKVPPPASGKHRRHLSVVGGTNSVPSLREAHRRRNLQQRKQVQPRAKSEEPSSSRSLSVAPSIQERRSSSADRTSHGCDLCSKVQAHWVNTDGLRKKTLLSDVVLRAVDGERFYCNSFVLGVWSKVLLQGARCEKGRSCEQEWIIDVDCAGEILHSTLRFMYGGTYSDMPPSHLPEVVTTADNYQIEDLKRACFLSAATAPLQIGNACAMWVFADEYDLQAAAKRAMRFVYTNLEKVVKDQDWDRVSHNVAMLMKLFEASVGWTTVNNDYRSAKQDDENVMPNALAQGVQAVWRDSNELSKKFAYSDKVIVAKSGRQFHVHSQIIYARSPSFAAFLQDEADAQAVRMNDMDDDVIEEFLRYLYRQEPSIAFPKLASLVHVLASTYDTPDLVHMCERHMAIQQLTSVKGAMQMLREAEEHRMKAAKSACFRYLYGNLGELRKCEDWRKLIHDEPQLLVEMMLESKRFRRLTNASD